MNGSESAIILDLRSLPEATALLRDVAVSLAAAASVVLERKHGPGADDAAAIVHGESTRSAMIVRLAIGDDARRTYDDPQEATEEGAEAVAILVARRVLDRVVFARLPKGTGADYKMRAAGLLVDDTYERLECSGIGDGTEATATRLREKVDQLARPANQPPGYAIVTNFVTTPVEIAIGSFPR